MKPRELALAAALTLVCLLPFAGKALHVDDPLFVWAAQQIAAHPLDPYGFQVNWYGTPLPMFVVTKNPPLVSYYLALWATLFGWHEAALHLSLLLPALAVVWGTYVLALRFSAPPLLAALAALFTPVFLVSATTVMCDVTMLALWIWSLILWERGLRLAHTPSLGAAALLAGLCALAKYFGIALIPLLALAALQQRPKVGRPLLLLLLPLLMLAAYQYATTVLYGRGLLLDAAAYATEQQAQSPGQYLARSILGLSFTGGCAASLLLLSPWLWTRRQAAAGLGAGVAVAALVSTAWARASLQLEEVTAATLPLQVGLWAAVGLGVLALAAADLRSTRDGVSLLLFVWVFGTFVFAAFINWTMNGRSVLPLIPAAGILAARRIGRQGPGRWPLRAALALSAALALAVTWADFGLAESAKQAALRIERNYDGRTIWFQGHWGFQYYAEQAGERPVDLARSLVPAGAVVVLPLGNTNVAGMPEGSTRLLEKLSVAVPRWVGTMAPEVGAGFYVSLWGPVPFGFGATSPPGYLVQETVTDVSFMPR